MIKQNVVDYLDKFDYKYVVYDDKIVVKLDLGLQIKIDLIESGKIKISNKLTRLNILTFGTSRSFKGAIVSNLIGALIVLFLFIGLRNRFDDFILTIVYMFGVYWNLCWLIYYLFRSENIKRQLIDLTK